MMRTRGNPSASTVANLGCHIPYEFAHLDLIGDFADWVRETYCKEGS